MKLSPVSLLSSALVLAVVVTFDAAAVAVEPDPAPAELTRDEILDSKDLESARIALLEGRGADAARALASLDPKMADGDLVLFLQATAHRLAGDLESAVAIFEKLVTRESPRFARRR